MELYIEIYIKSRFGKCVHLIGSKKKRSIIFSDEIGLKLLEHYGGNAGHNLEEDRGKLGYGFIHYSLILNCRPQHVLCLGSAKGFIPAICALACRDNGVGRVDFVDAGYNTDNPNSWGGIGFWKNIDINKHFSFLNLSPWITTHVMTTNQFAKNTNTKWQYIYVDADHSYEGVMRDYSLFWPRLEKGGFMIFHDVLLKKHPKYLNFGVWKFWEKLPDKNKVTIPYTVSDMLPSGLGILQKK